MNAEQDKPMGKTRFYYAIAGMLILGVAVPAAAVAVLHLLFSGRPLVNPSLHAFMESLGVIAAFLLAVLLLFIRRQDRDLAPHIWIACGLLAMGILDGLHATETSLGPFVGLRSASTLFSGILFSLVWLPERASRSRAADALPVITVAVSGFLGLFMVADPNLLPAMVALEGYTTASRIINSTGGVLFFVAAARFVDRYRASEGFDDFLFASLCLLFGMAGVLFPFSSIWYADWWLWHLLRLVAFLHIIYYLFFVFQQTLAELKELNETLERRVMERTAQLAAEVAERQQTEAALKESETRYRRLVESVTGYIYTVRIEDGRPTGTSHSTGCEAVTGYTPEEYAADPGLWLHMVQEEDRQAVLDQAALVLSGSEAPPLEHRLYHKDGRVRWVKNRTVPRFDGGGRLVAYDGLVSDITERKLAEEEIRTYNEELLTINRVVTACSSILDLKEVLGRVLEETMRIVGLEEGSICILNKDGSLNFIAHRGPAAMVTIDPGVGYGMSGECFYRTCGEHFRPIILRDREAVLRFADRSWPHSGDIRFHAAFPLVTGKRTCFGVLCLFSQTETKPSERSLRLVQTITAHVALVLENVRLYEESLSHAATLEGKVAQRTLELEEANRKLQEIDRTKSLFIASMSHELRTPLNSVIGFSSILLDEWVGPLNDEQKENLGIVLRAGEHLLSLINDAIDVSKIEAGQIAIIRETFDLSDVIAEAVATLGKEIRDKGLELRVDNVHRTMHTDRQRLLQCLLNLLNNAAKYTEKGSISVRARDIVGEESTLPEDGRPSCRDFVEIAVEDTGIGIGEEDLRRIFEPFTRLNSPLLPRPAPASGST
jgi:PAS domain S-box-containing protein